MRVDCNFIPLMRRFRKCDLYPSHQAAKVWVHFILYIRCIILCISVPYFSGVLWLSSDALSWVSLKYKEVILGDDLAVVVYNYNYEGKPNNGETESILDV